MQMSLMPPNMSDSLAGNWFLKSKSIGILTLQTLNSFFWNTELWRRTTTSRWLFFLFLYVAWVSAWMTSVFFFFLYSCHYQDLFQLLFLILPTIQIASLDLKSQLSLAQWTYLHFHFLCYLSFLLLQRAFLQQITAFRIHTLNSGELLDQSYTFLLCFHSPSWSLCYFLLCSKYLGGRGKSYFYFL